MNMGYENAAKHRRLADVGLRCIVVFLVLLLVAGLGLIAYPTVADVWNRMHQSRAVASYIEQTEDLGKEQREQLLMQAEEYNQQLESSALSDQMMRWNAAMRPSDAGKNAYENVLDVSGTGIMGYVTIPKLKTRLPIYHGTDDAVLQIAVGHLPGSSLPVGGEGSHAVISGHTGLPSARLLTGLDELEPGDTFAFHVLGKTMTYQVDQVKVVLPDDFAYLDIDQSKDYATLITCTPYGINSHRLLVRGHRISNPVTPDATDYDWESEAFIAALVAFAVFISGLLTIAISRRIRRSRAAAQPGRHINAHLSDKTSGWNSLSGSGLTSDSNIADFNTADSDTIAPTAVGSADTDSVDSDSAMRPSIGGSVS